MDILYVVYEFEVVKLSSDKFEEDKLCIYIDGQKIYKSQMNDLTLLGKYIVVITEDESKIKYWQNEIKQFYKTYCREVSLWHIRK